MPATRQRFDDGDSELSFAIAAITGTGNVTTDLQTRITAAISEVQNSTDVNPAAGDGPEVSCVTSIAAPPLVAVRVTQLRTAPIVSGLARNIAVLAKGQR